MNTTKKIFALLLIGTISISTLYAAGFPDEPMVIYGNVSESYSGELKIYDENNVLLKTVSVKDGKYGTDKTFDEKKIMMTSFPGNLIFKIEGQEIIDIQESSIYPCNENPEFQGGEICQYNLILKDDTTQAFQDIFDGKVFEEKKEELKSELGENIMRYFSGQDNIKVLSKKLNIINKSIKDTILLDLSKKEALYIPRDTTLSNNDVIIEVPKKISDTTTISSKINRKVVGAVDIPTNKQITFNKAIRVCTSTTHNNSLGLSIFYSHDNINWTFDTSATQLEVSNGQVCFNVNHLTSFAVGYEVPSTNTGGSSSSKKRDNCPDGDYTNSRYDKECGEEENIALTNNGEITNDNSFSGTLNETELEISSEPTSADINSFLSDIFSTEDTESKETQKVEKNEIGEITIDSKSYIRNLKRFNAANKKLINDSGYSVIHIHGDMDYNKKIEKYTAKIFQDITHPSIRESMFKHMNRMSTTYGIYYDDEIDEELKPTYREKLKRDIIEFELKLKKLKIKNMIVKNTLEKRRLRDLEEQKKD